MSTPNSTTGSQEEITLILLGDADFSYALDWARYLAARNNIFPDKTLHLIATGLDSKEALNLKYKDSSFLLTKLKGMDGGNNLRVSCYHNTNAIQPTHRPHNLPPARHVS